jgi:hypothetical protein
LQLTYWRLGRIAFFQYGFTKIRRGVDTDMYAHPSFVRDQPEALLQLQKCTTKSRRRLDSDASGEPRSVSPPLSDVLTQGALPLTSLLTKSHSAQKIVIHGFNAWAHSNPTQVSPTGQSRYPVARSDSDESSTGSTNDRGKLDLLAFALEREFGSLS